MIPTAIAFLRGLKLSHIAMIALAVTASLYIFLYKAEQRHSAKLQAQLVKSVEGRKADRASYEQAQRDAAALNKATVEKIEARSQEITQDVAQDYASDLARLRAELGRLRGQGAANQGVAGSAPASPTGKPAQGVDGAAPVSVPASVVLRAAETELQLDALITWVEEQLKVER